jgi:hypothetical protein
MIRTTNPDVIEHRLLELAFTTDAKITASALAYFAPCSIEDAQKVLDALSARERIRMEIDDDGGIYYLVPDRQKLRPAPPPPTALVPFSRPAPIMYRAREASPALAAILSFFIPGAGQLYTGHVLSALLWFLVVSAGYVLILPGLVLHLFNIVSAASSANRMNAAAARMQLAARA